RELVGRRGSRDEARRQSDIRQRRHPGVIGATASEQNPNFHPTNRPVFREKRSRRGKQRWGPTIAFPPRRAFRHENQKRGFGSLSSQSLSPALSCSQPFLFSLDFEPVNCRLGC